MLRNNELIFWKKLQKNRDSPVAHRRLGRISTHFTLGANQT